MMFALIRERGMNMIGDLTTGLVNNMRFSDRNVLYPGEAAAIKDYEQITKKAAALPQNAATLYTLQLLAKLIADERLHITLFEERQREEKLLNRL